MLAAGLSSGTQAHSVRGTCAVSRGRSLTSCGRGRPGAQWPLAPQALGADAAAFNFTVPITALPRLKELCGVPERTLSLFFRVK